MAFDNTYVKIDLDVIAENFETICQKAGVPVLAIVKADAYGHGAIQIARLLHGKCAFFGVSSMLEALELRQAGLDDPILILGQTPVSAFPIAIKEGIRPTIFRWEDACALSDAAIALGVNAPFHLAVDTGMGRIGFLPSEESADLCAKIVQLPGLTVEGIFSHYATADCADLSCACDQAALFDRFCQMLTDRGVQVPIRHMDNSAGLVRFSNHYDLVRAGIVTYGMFPSEQASSIAVRPALQWISRITHLKELPAGSPISYGATYVTTAPTRVATIPVGYADGYCRSLSGKFYVLIHGQKAPILGRICMDQMMVDVTHIADVAVEDEVTLVGKNGSKTISVEEISAAANSFNYEFVCGISRRVPRIYYQNGIQTAAVRYLLDD